MLQTSLKFLKSPQTPNKQLLAHRTPKSSIWSLCDRTSCQVAPSPALVVASLGSHHNPSQAPPVKHRQLPAADHLCSSYQVAPGWTQAAAHLGLYWSPSSKAPEQIYLVTSFRSHHSTTQLVPKGLTLQAPEPH